MNLSKALSVELARLALLVLAALILKAIFGSFWASFGILCIAYLTWHFVNFRRLLLWLENPSDAPPSSSGIWEAIFNHLYKNQKKTQNDKRRLKRQIDRIEESATALPDGTVILNKKNIIEWFNESAERVLGLRRKIDFGQHIDNLVRNPTFVDYLHGDDYGEFIEIRSPVNQNIILRIRLVRYGNKQKLLLARNITRVHHLEQMRRDFIANVSHELRTPLTVITGFLENLDDSQSSCSEQWQRPIRLMQEQSDRMLNIIDDLLFLSRLETDTTSGKKHPVNVPGILNSIREDAINYSGENQHVVEMNVDGKLYLKGDQNELFSAFSNLVINAIKYTPPGGTIKINWFQNNDGQAVFEAVDNGIGIPSQHIPRLTERFYRVDVGRSREQGGTGLGLAIVKHVMIRHNACLEINSVIGQGSTFRCVFPESLVSKQ